MSASNAAAKEPAEGDSGAAKPAEPDSAIKDFDGGGGGSHGDALKTRARSGGVVGELRDISEKGTKLTQDQKAAMLAKIERAFPHESDRQRGMKSLLRASQMNRKRDIEKERAFLNKSEADQNTPERLRKLGEIDRYYERFNEQQRRDLNVARGKARAIRDNRVEILLERIKNREDNLEALARARANGEPTAVFKRNIAGIDTPIREQVPRVVQANQAYAALAGLPHPDIDKRGAALQEDIELAERNSGRFGVDLAMGLAGGAAGVAAKTLAKGTAKRVAGRVGAGVAIAEVATAFSRNVQDRVGKEIDKAGIDAGDPAAIRKFAEANKGLLQDATNKALIAAVGGKFSKNAAGNLSRLIGGNLFVRDSVETGINKVIDAGIKKIRP